MADDQHSMKEFGASFKGFLDQMARNAPKPEPHFLLEVRDHFGTDPSRLPIVGEKIDVSDHPNLQVALDDYLGGAGRTHRLLGVQHTRGLTEVNLSTLVAPGEGGLASMAGIGPGPVQYATIRLGDDRVIACVRTGLFLVVEGERRLVLLVHSGGDFVLREKLHVEVMALDRATAESVLAELRRAMRSHNVFRGQMVSVESDERGFESRIKFHRLPPVERDDIILPPGLLERIERETVGFARHSGRLRAAGQHLRRGLLLHGPPGTGRSLSLKYIARQMSDRTVILLTGRILGLMGRSCQLARLLQPSIVVLEDVDLVAGERSQNAAAPILVELLNEMDGLGEDAEVLFLLTTNRPGVLEPALASRPGRVDQALEIPLPDADCRRRLFALYGRGVDLRLEQLDRWIERTERASAAFIRELIRKAALLAADGAAELVVRDEHVELALRELVSGDGSLTRRLLGFRDPEGP